MKKATESPLKLKRALRATVKDANERVESLRTEIYRLRERNEFLESAVQEIAKHLEQHERLNSLLVKTIEQYQAGKR